MPTSKRNQSLQALGDVKESQRYVLSNARCLSEGVDVPALDGVAFIDPRQSEIDIVQAVGRAIRLSDGKELGTIVIPVFLSESDDADEVLNSSPFKAVWGVVNALRSHDELLGKELDHLRMQLGKRGTVGKPDKIIFDLPAKIGQSFEKALETRLLETTTASWEFWFGLLETYKEEYGDCLIPRGYKLDGYALDRWLSKQRTNQGKGVLAPERVQRLNELGFVWDALAAQWEQGFASLKAYKEKYGDCLMPRGYKLDGYALSRWLSNQRTSQREGKLASDRVKRFDELGFVWHPYTAKWQQGFASLKVYKEKYGDCFVPISYKTDDEFQLGVWVNNKL